jgi:hypothetical protein
MSTKGQSPLQGGSANGQKGPRVGSRRGTGPRTVIGKVRTRLNALKHGLYAQVVVLNDEPRSQFDALLCGLRQDLMPKGMLEEILVEKLASIFWRYRRLLQAESGEVLTNKQEERAWKMRKGIAARSASAQMEKEIARTDRRGYLWDIYDLNAVNLSIDKLQEVIENAEAFGLCHETHVDTLGLLYGARFAGRPGKDLFDYYLECQSAKKGSAAERERRGFDSEVDCEQKFIAATKREIHRLEGRRKYARGRKWHPEIIDDEPRAEALLKCAIPDSEMMDRLLRYEASVERAFDRTLLQLERLQGTRESKKTIEVEHQTTTSE